MRRLIVFALAALMSVPAFSQVHFNMIQMGQKGGAIVGDFNGDGREDILAITAGGKAFHMLVSTGTGTYNAETSYTIPSAETISNFYLLNSGYAVGDFNRDGKLDLAIIAGSYSTYHLYIYLGAGNGTFHSPIVTSLSYNPAAIAAADVNHDGKMDLLIINPTNANNQGHIIQTYFGNGSGGFTPGPATVTPDNFYSLYTGDFDGDGKVDLLGSDCGVGGCIYSIFYGDGAGNFGSEIHEYENSALITVADVDGDGKSDIIISAVGYEQYSSDSPFLTVYYGSASRSLQSAQIPTSQCAYGRPVVADFNGDHIPDIVFPEHDCSSSPSSAQMAFLAGRGNRAFGSEQTLFNSTFGQQPGGDTTVMRANNSDSKPDFYFSQDATANSSTKDYYLMVNGTSGKFAGCNAPNSPTGFRICSPASGSTVYSPVKFSIGASGPVLMRKVEVWVDGVKKYEQLYAFSHYAYLDTSLALAKGTHAISIVSAGWDNSLQKKSYSINVQ